MASREKNKCELRIDPRNRNVAKSLTFNGLTRGEVLALVNALEKHSQVSPVAADLLAYARGAGVEDWANSVAVQAQPE